MPFIGNKDPKLIPWDFTFKQSFYFKDDLDNNYNLFIQLHGRYVTAHAARLTHFYLGRYIDHLLSDLLDSKTYLKYVINPFRSIVFAEVMT